MYKKGCLKKEPDYYEVIENVNTMPNLENFFDTKHNKLKFRSKWNREIMEFFLNGSEIRQIQESYK